MSATTYSEDTRLDARGPTTRCESRGRADVLPAQRLLSGRVVRTPVVRSEELDRRAGGRVWLKSENLQRGGSFKLRGA